MAWWVVIDIKLRLSDMTAGPWHAFSNQDVRLSATVELPLILSALPDPSLPRLLLPSLQVSVWEKDSGHVVQSLPLAHSKAVLNVSISSDGLTIASVGADGKVRKRPVTKVRIIIWLEFRMGWRSSSGVV